MERAPPPPPPAPPPPPPPETPGTPGTPPGLGRVLREALQRAGQALGEDGGLRELLRRRRDWCGLVALSMAGALLGPPRPQLGLGALLDTARARGYTRHGEMFSAAHMAALAQELLPCRAELLQGGLGGHNRGRVLRHLLGGRPLLVPYDEDSNHAPSCRRGHKAHWALINGVVVAVPPQEPLGPQFRQDPEIPNVFHAQFGEGSPCGEGSLFGEGSPFGEGSRFWEEFAPGNPGEEQEGSGGSRGAGEGSQSHATPNLGLGSHFGEGSHSEAVPHLGSSSHFEEGSHSEAVPNFGHDSHFEDGSPSRSIPDLGRGSPFGAGVLLLALQGKSPRPQLWPLGELGASNAQLGELSPRRWGGGFVLPPGGLRQGLGGRAVLLHPRETPPQ